MFLDLSRYSGFTMCLFFHQKIYIEIEKMFKSSMQCIRISLCNVLEIEHRLYT